MKKILLDTNAYISYLAGDEKVLDFLASADVVYVSVFVAGELSSGFRGGTKYRQKKLEFERFLHKAAVEFFKCNRNNRGCIWPIEKHVKKSRNITADK